MYHHVSPQHLSASWLLFQTSPPFPSMLSPRRTQAEELGKAVAEAAKALMDDEKLTQLSSEDLGPGLGGLGDGAGRNGGMVSCCL